MAERRARTDADGNGGGIRFRRVGDGTQGKGVDAGGFGGRADVRCALCGRVTPHAAIHGFVGEAIGGLVFVTEGVGDLEAL